MTAVMDLPAENHREARATQLAVVPAVSLNVLRAVALSIIAMKLVFSAIVPPGFDDAYYWLWGQHLQWSYLDHAPMVGWGSWVGYHLLGWNALGMHFLPLVSFALSVLVMRSWARRIAPDHWQHYFWAMLAVFLASPLLMAISTILYPDQALMAASLGALHFLALFLADWRTGAKRYRNLYIGAVLVGLAMLSKYNGALIGLGFFAAVLADPKLRSLLRSKHLYLAALLAALCLLPIVGWNVANDFASLKLHTSDRFVRGDRGFSWNGPLRFLPQTALYFSPFLIWPLVRSLVARGVPGPQGAVVAMGRWIFIASTIALTGLAAWGPASTQVAPHWEIVAFMPFVLLAPLFVRSRWLMGLHLGFGTIIAGLAVAYYLSAPLLTNALGIVDTEASHNYGQEQLAAAIGKEEWANGASFVAARRYTLGAKLSYGAGSDQGIISISPEIDGFYFWHDLKALAGKSAIILSEDTIGPDGLNDEFSSVTSLGSFTPQRFGQPIGTYYLYLGRGFHGKAPAP